LYLSSVNLTPETWCEAQKIVVTKGPIPSGGIVIAGNSQMSDLIDNTYSKALVSYVDILGFADLINESRANLSRVGKIASLLMTLKDELSVGGRVHRHFDGRTERIFDSFNFSDLIVRSTRIPPGADVSEFVDWELFYLGEKQFSLASEGNLIRGGICIDDMFVGAGRSILFGPALVKSYKLESQYAIYPRIIIDRDLVVQADQGGYGQRWADYIHRGEDGAYFLDYLFGCSITGFADPQADDPNPRIEAHREMIENVISKNIRDRDERIKQKYMWLALYHNATIKRLQSRLEGSTSNVPDRFFIPESLLNF
jgi:hypothetical protein